MMNNKRGLVFLFASAVLMLRPWELHHSGPKKPEFDGIVLRPVEINATSSYPIAYDKPNAEMLAYSPD